ncbi:MAG TPA: hypothetical protein VHT73_08755 [Thermodesulfobacteriota bacterium]|nr:hypothetical protein [Thermodesulfobacteriota bacterium]
MANIREIRILIDYRSGLRILCKLAFTKADASLYLFPYAIHGTYYYGGRLLPEKQIQDTFDFTADLNARHTPKLSIHEKGQVHIIADGVRAGPLFIPPLVTLKGQHIATVCPDVFSILPVLQRKPKFTGAEIDHIIPVEDGIDSGRLAVYIAGDKPSFEAPNCRLVVTLKRPTIPEPLYIGIKPIGQKLIGVDVQSGVTIIAGWDPTKSSQGTNDYLYIRGE